MIEGKRVYRSPLRAEQARRTRRAVVDAATACFLDQGYAATTMRDVAQAAGVSVQTVFGQGSKSALLLACVDRALVGDDEDAPLLARDLFQRLFQADDRGEKLRLLREITVRYVPQTAPVMRVFAAAAAADPEIADAYAEYGRRRYEDSRAMVTAFEPWLRPDLDVDRATDVAWSVFSHETAAALAGERGWGPEGYADWLVDAVDRLLLR